MQWGHTTISADRGGRAARRDNVIIGIPPEQLPAILQAAVKEATDPLKQLNAEQSETVARLERTLGATREQVFSFFRIIGEASVQLEAIPTRLVEIAERYKASLAQAATEPGDDPETVGLKTGLRAALEKPDLQRADALLAEEQTAQDRDLERRGLQAATICAQRGEIARTQLHYYKAAEHFAAAAARVPAAHEPERTFYLFQQAKSLDLQGVEFGDNAALVAAIQAWQELVTKCPRERVPLNWAAAQMGLGAGACDAWRT